jgi:hypothetical protein
MANAINQKVTRIQAKWQPLDTGKSTHYFEKAPLQATTSPAKADRAETKAISLRSERDMRKMRLPFTVPIMPA